MKHVLSLLCVVALNIMLMRGCEQRRECVPSPACICRTSHELCWDQR